MHERKTIYLKKQLDYSTFKLIVKIAQHCGFFPTRRTAFIVDKTSDKLDNSDVFLAIDVWSDGKKRIRAPRPRYCTQTNNHLTTTTIGDFILEIIKNAKGYQYTRKYT